MIILFSPAKTFKNSNKNTFLTHPYFENEAVKIAEIFKKAETKELKNIFKVSEKVAEKVYEYYQGFDISDDVLSSGIDTFNGQAYKKLDFDSLNQHEKQYLQDRMVILSALYGKIRPFDGIMPYRLDFKNYTVCSKKVNLSSLWGDSIYKFLEEDAEGLIFNFASDEYSKMISKYINDSILFITPVFNIKKGDKYVSDSMTSKSCRGKIMRFAAVNNVENYEDLKCFEYDGFKYDEKLSYKENNKIYLIFTKNK